MAVRCSYHNLLRDLSGYLAMFGRFLPYLALGLALPALVPTTIAWNLDATQTTSAETAAWIPGFGPPGGTDLPGDLRPAVACALGDVNGDGVGDVLMRIRDPAGQVDRLRALAGPDFKTAVWEVATKGQRVMHCAPDLNMDGVGDPVTSLVSQASGGGSMSGQKTVDRATQVLDGASGQALVRRQHQDSDTSAGSGGVSASSSAAAQLLPASVGAEAFVKTEVQQSALSGLPSASPTSSLTATARRAAELQLLDAKGTVQGIIKIDSPGTDPLAMAPLPSGLGLPDVAVLTAQAASRVDEASRRVPTLSRFNPDGSLAWAVELSGTTGLPVLVPRAGDLDLDGVEDLIVETVPSGVSAGAAGQFQVLSGIDGRQLFSSGAPADGLVAALPLGSLPTGEPALLSAKQVTGAGKLTLQALTATGQAAWSVDVEANSIPINALVDSYTGDPLGFTDLTGDGIPDVGVAARQGAGLVLQAVDGAHGSISWTVTLTDVERVVPVSPRDTLGKVTAVGVPHPSDLLAIGNASHGPNLTLIRGTTGDVVWRLKGSLPPGTDRVEASLHEAGDLNRDGVQDLLLTLDPRTAAEADQSVYAISGADGTAVWSNSTDPSMPTIKLAAEKGPAYEERAKALATEAKGRAPEPMAVALLGVLVATAILRRLRR